MNDGGEPPSSPALDRAHQIRAACVRDLLQVLGADLAEYGLFVRGPDRLVRLHGTRAIRASPEVAARWEACEGGAFMFSEADPDHLACVNRLLPPPDDFFDTPFIRWALVELGYRQVVFCNVAEDDVHRGTVAFIRRGEDAWEADPSALRRAAAQVIAQFTAAWHVERALAPPGAAVDLRGDGSLAGEPEMVAWAERVELARWAAERFAEPRPPTPLGPSQLRSGPACLVRRVAHADGGATLLFDPVAPMVLPPVLTRLSPAQKRIVSLAAGGATVAEIARTTGRAPRTVREHLARAYAALGVSSRAELVTVLREMLV